MGSDVVIIGGGIIGLATAVELSLQGAQVTVLSQQFRAAAAHAAAGMLAPQAEGILPGAMLDLCLRSRALYPEWVRKLEGLTGLDTGYWPCGILAPLYVDCLPTPQKMEGLWLDRAAIAHHQPGLSTELAGGWWFPEDGQVDNRALMQTLWIAAQTLGVTLQEGVAVHNIEYQGHRITQLQTSAGVQQGDTYVLSAGAWSGQLLPLPVVPRKGQMLALQVPTELEAPLSQVLFGTEIYIVPRQNGRIILGATSEDVGFAPHNTPAGIQQLLSGATRLYPALKDFAIAEFWWGYRPATPDECPILGASPYQNLVLATGHYRNGILLAPVTARLIAALIGQSNEDPLLASFSCDRFAVPAANTLR
ncbi:glycine oxidase ThiO [Synechococcales cyanobacterium C]|uniref:glycine oxidase n=1 Tax=Petrachloros mirabilis ULC683 TaxID=2781853 RepID=A0A8K1ZYT0_9CYAN|nr:glycine oxidase ThiO [Petrachloros mirabilis ULC683]